MEQFLGYPRELIIGVVILGFVSFWVIGLIRKIGGCLIHLALVAAGLALLYYFFTVAQSSVAALLVYSFL